MKLLEILVTFIFFIGIIYTVVPLALSVYCLVELPYANNEFAVDKTVVYDVKEAINDHCLPVPAYVNTTHQPKTIAELRTALQVCNPPQPYGKSYDCSELSAYTEHYLENNGFNTTISASLTEGHAWSTVHNIVGYNVVHVECVPPARIRQGIPPIELSYDNIQEALAGDYPYEWVWWLK